MFSGTASIAASLSKKLVVSFTDNEIYVTIVQERNQHILKL